MVRVFLSLLICTMLNQNVFARDENFVLPKPDFTRDISLIEALNQRKSVRSFKDSPLTISDISSILWAAYGPNKWGRKTVPSAGALYPLSVYAIVGNVDGIDSGVYLYQAKEHELKKIKDNDLRGDLAKTVYQGFVSQASLILVVSANYKTTTSKYGERGRRYVYIDSGYVSQNIYLMTGALGLGTVVIGSFNDAKLKKFLGTKEDPLYLMPIAHPNN